MPRHQCVGDDERSYTGRPALVGGPCEAIEAVGYPDASRLIRVSDRPAASQEPGQVPARPTRGTFP
jgi:hypothetical protein